MTYGYEDIIHLPHPEPKTRPRMPIEARAAQFAPFAALTGYDAAVLETARHTDRMPELTEDQRSLIDAALQRLWAEIDTRPEVWIEYFVPDERKAGGALVTVQAAVRRIDMNDGRLLLADDTEIAFRHIYRIEWVRERPEEETV